MSNHATTSGQPISVKVDREGISALAKTMKNALATLGLPVKHQQAIGVLGQMLGFASPNALLAELGPRRRPTARPLKAPTPLQRVVTLTISHAYGTDVSIHTSEQDARTAAAMFCREPWTAEGLKGDPELLADEDVIEAYFARMQDEQVDITSLDVPAGWSITAPAVNSVTPDRPAFKLGANSAGDIIITEPKTDLPLGYTELSHALDLGTAGLDFTGGIEVHVFASLLEAQAMATGVDYAGYDHVTTTVISLPGGPSVCAVGNGDSDDGHVRIADHRDPTA